jgi:hypothetical protein
MPEEQPTAQVASLEAINTKLDQILDYQKSAHRWAIIKGVVNFTLFMVLVVLPIVGLYFFLRSLSSQIDFNKLVGQYNQATSILNQVDSMQGQLQNGAVQDLMKKLPGLKP